MAAKSKLKFELGYADSTTRLWELGTFNPSDTSLFKAKIKAFNSTGLADVAGVLLSVTTRNRRADL